MAGAILRYHLDAIFWGRIDWTFAPITQEARLLRLDGRLHVPLLALELGTIGRCWRLWCILHLVFGRHHEMEWVWFLGLRRLLFGMDNSLRIDVVVADCLVDQLDCSLRLNDLALLLIEQLSLELFNLLVLGSADILHIIDLGLEIAIQLSNSISVDSEDGLVWV